MYEKHRVGAKIGIQKLLVGLVLLEHDLVHRYFIQFDHQWC